MSQNLSCDRPQKLEIQEWKSAVDSRTGKTYWYHKISRETTWTNPYIIHSDTPERPSIRRKIDISDDGLNNSDMFEVLMEDLSVLINFLSDPSIEIRWEALQLLFAFCVPSSIEKVIKEKQILNILADIVITASSASFRRTALRCLCSIASNVKAVELFQSSKDWIKVINVMTTWRDVESGILFIFMVCLILSHFTDQNLNHMRNEICHQQLTQWMNSDFVLDSSLEIDTLVVHPSSSGMSLLDPQVFRPLLCLCLRGDELPALLLLFVLDRCMR